MALRLKEFRDVYGAKLTREEALELWGENLSGKLINELPLKEDTDPVSERKIRIAKKLVKKIIIPGVKYIGISGSVASNTASEEDDIDLFIVVRDNTSWILRAYFKFRLGKDVVWYGQKDQKDKACVNYICEERGLSFQDHDIFTFNEIALLKGVHNEKYFDQIMAKNRWIFNKFLVLDTYNDTGVMNSGNTILKALLLPFNLISFFGQFLYMLLMGHDPEPRRWLRGLRNGRIEHFPEDFRIEKLENFNSST